MMKKPVIFLIAAAAMAAVIGGAAYFHANYVILGDTLIAHNGDPEYDDIYRRDETRIWLHERLGGFNTAELNRCTALEDLMLHCPDNETLADLSAFEHLQMLTIFIADEPLTADGMAFISRQPVLETFWCHGTDADLTGLRSDSLREVVFFGAQITNLSELANCPALEELHCSDIVIGDHLRRVDETDPAVNQYVTEADGEGFVIRPMEKVDIKFYMDDSSDFAALDQVRTLHFTDVTFNDISGLLDMDSLAELTLRDCEITDADRMALEERGITVTLDTGEE